MGGAAFATPRPSFAIWGSAVAVVVAPGLDVGLRLLNGSLVGRLRIGHRVSQHLEVVRDLVRSLVSELLDRCLVRDLARTDDVLGLATELVFATTDQREGTNHHR